ncbi:MAG TPA: hypothetical protein VGI82_14575, partial [Chitinophagaceae bacterium]
MKRKKINSLLWFSGTALSLFVVCVPQTKLLAADHSGKINLVAKSFDDDKKPAKKEKSFKNQNVVKIYPDALRKTIHVVAKSGNEKEIDFLVFDINGNMVL